MMIREYMRDKSLAIVLLGILLAFLFYWIDPVVFLEKLGYATLAVLSLVELAELVLERWQKTGE
jgi:hypothetical protein